VIYPNSCRKTFEGAVHGSEVYSAGVGPKGLALSRFPIIKKTVMHPTNSIFLGTFTLQIFFHEKSTTNGL
jgi:hypothetical protein